MWAVHQLYNTLVQMDDHLNIVPSLAKSWDISADNFTFTFHFAMMFSFMIMRPSPVAKEEN